MCMSVCFLFICLCLYFSADFLNSVNLGYHIVCQLGTHKWTLLPDALGKISVDIVHFFSVDLVKFL